MRWIAPVALVTLVAACGGSSEAQVDAVERIVPVDGDLAEIVFALGLGDQVVATDLSATYPPEADALPQIGYQRALTAEPIAAVDPTMVLATDLAGPPETLDQLRELGIPVVVIERQLTLDGPAAKIRAVAETLERRASAARSWSPSWTTTSTPPSMQPPMSRSDRGRSCCTCAANRSS